MGKRGQRIRNGEATRERILAIINKYQETHGCMPTISQIGEGVGIKSDSALYRHLKVLREAGKISEKPTFNYNIHGEASRTKILEAINGFFIENGRMPSVREIMNITGFKSPSTIYANLNVLKKQGRISIDLNAFIYKERKSAKTKVLEAISIYYEKNASFPTVEEIKSITGYISNETIKKYIKVLIDEKKIPEDCAIHGAYKGVPTRMKIMNAINKYYETYGFSPSVRDLGEMVGLKSSATVYGHLERLKKKGKITWNPAMRRTIRVINKDK